LEQVIQLQESSAGGAGGFLRWASGGGDTVIFERPYGVAWDGEDLLVTDPGAWRVVRIDPRGKLTVSPEGTVENPIGVAVCQDGVVVSDASAGKIVLLGPDLRRIDWIAEGIERPTGIACEGNEIFVVETGKHQVLARQPDGTWRVIGERGGGEAQFNFPTSVTVDNGWLWVGDTLNFRIQRLDAESGDFYHDFGHLGDSAGDMPRLKGIAIDGSGRAWVSDAYLDRVSLYTPDGVLLMSLGRTGVEPGEFSFPAGIAAHPDGRVAVVDSLNRRVQVFRVLEPGAKQP
jgi:DNA-binding beta-propeller fold protein YncE